MKLYTKIIGALLCLVLLFTGIAPTFQNGKTTPVVRSMELSSSALDSQSCFEAFDQYSYEIEEGKASFVGFKEFSLGDLYDLDLIADSDASSAVYTRFSCEYDYENSIVTLNALLVSDVETVVLDTMYGVIFMNDDMEFDVAFDCDGEILLLSEMREAGMLDEVGLFSKIGSTLKKVWNTTSGKIGTIATVAACAAVGAVCAVVPGGQLITAVCIGVAVGAVGGAVTAAAATYEADGEVDWEAVGICAGVGAAVGGAVSAASYGITTAIKTAVQTAKAGTSCSGGSCFVAGTQILTENGYVAIENIEVGNFVWANNPVTGKTALKEVVQIFRNVTTEWVHVTVNGEEIVCTPTHPFYSPARGWISAGELKKGDILLTAQNEFVSVGKIDVEELETPEITYNFEVEGFHTYFVGENAVLVHNACSSFGSNLKLSDQKMYQIGDHFNKHGRAMGFESKKAYEEGARAFFERVKDTAKILEGNFNSAHGGVIESEAKQLIIQAEGMQLIIDSVTGQIMDFYYIVGDGLSSFVNVIVMQLG